MTGQIVLPQIVNRTDIMYYIKYIIALLEFIVLSNGKTFDNYKVYSVIPKNEVQVQILQDLRKSDHSFDFWTDVFHVNSDVRIMVPPEKDEGFVKYIRSVGLDATLRLKNVQELIDAQLQPSQNTKASLGSFTWNQYHTLEEIYAWLDELKALYPDVVTLVTIGSSYEGRDIKGIIIDFKPGQRGDKPLTGMIEGGTHAREWISPATVTWIIKEFLTSTDDDVRSMAETFIWHIIPVVNPDGYSYTFTNNRMWRKNRNPTNYVNCSGDSDIGNGIDLNRNYDFLWITVGASSDPCSTTYAGPSPASEPETIAISNYVEELKSDGELIYYIAFHSYSQMVLLPYSHASGNNVLQANNYGDMYEIAIRGAAKLTEVHGTQYTVGTSADILYEVSGSSFDWVKGVHDVPIVYLLELRDVGAYGFLLLPKEIIPNNEEVMAFMKEMDRSTRTLGYFYSSGTRISSVCGLFISVVLFIIVQ